MQQPKAKSDSPLTDMASTVVLLAIFLPPILGITVGWGFRLMLWASGL